MDKWDKPYINKEDGKRHNNKEDNDHIYPTSRGGQNIEENKIKIYHTLHMASHQVWWNAVPAEALMQVLKMKAKVLSEQFRDELTALLEFALKNENRAYVNGIYVKK